MTWIKICGLTRLEDAEAVAESGADAAGFVFHPPSPRHVDAQRAAAIARRLPPRIARVGVFVNATDEEMEAARLQVGLDLVQLHGDEAANAKPRVACGVLRVARTARDVDALLSVLGEDAAILVDGCVPGSYGGTGHAANASALAAARRARRWTLSGGLDAANVAARLRTFSPWGVDVSTGVESAPGRKDAARIFAFVAAVRSSGAMPRSVAAR